MLQQAQPGPSAPCLSGTRDKRARDSSTNGRTRSLPGPGSRWARTTSGSPAAAKNRTPSAASSSSWNRPASPTGPHRPSAGPASRPAPTRSPAASTGADQHAWQPRQPPPGRRPQERRRPGPRRAGPAGDDPPRTAHHLPRPRPDRRRLARLPLPVRRHPPTCRATEGPTAKPPATAGHAAARRPSSVVRTLTAQLTELKRRHRDEVQALRQALEAAQSENLELRRRLGPRHTTQPATS